MAAQTLKMVPAGLNLELYAGDANSFGVEITEDGTLVNITGWTFMAQARKQSTDLAAVATATCTILDPEAGQVEVAWGDLRAVLADASKWVGVWDLQATPTGASLPRTLLAGSFTVGLDVTRVDTP